MHSARPDPVSPHQLAAGFRVPSRARMSIERPRTVRPPLRRSDDRICDDITAAAPAAPENQDSPHGVRAMHDNGRGAVAVPLRHARAVPRGVHGDHADHAGGAVALDHLRARGSRRARRDEPLPHRRTARPRGPRPGRMPRLARRSGRPAAPPVVRRRGDRSRRPSRAASGHPARTAQPNSATVRPQVIRRSAANGRRTRFRMHVHMSIREQRPTLSADGYGHNRS